MIRRTLVVLALLAAPAIAVAQQPTPMQGQAPAADTTKPKAAHKATAKKHAAKKAAAKKPAAKPAAKDTSKTKP
jgi:hypothetical protein